MGARSVGLGLLGCFSIALGGTAWACPGGYSTASCDGGATSDVCEVAAGHIYECDLTRNGGTSSGNLTAVYGYGGSYDYSVWGDDAAGNAFCCQVTNTSLDQVMALGGSGGDTLAFTYSTGGTTYNLSAHPSALLVRGLAFGRGGDDTITGSGQSLGTYRDELQGDDGDDTIAGGNGNDTIFGGEDNDTLQGDDGDDTLHGDPGADDIAGGNGNDTLTGDGDDDLLDAGAGNDSAQGGPGADAIAGGNGNDTLLGDDGIDFICGDNGSDMLQGGASGDVLWDSSGVNSGNGGTGTDDCGGSGTIYQACETNTYSSRPSGCP